MSGSGDYQYDHLLNRTLYNSQEELDPGEPIDLTKCLERGKSITQPSVERAVENLDYGLRVLPQKRCSA